ncbi:glycosyltransferase [Alteromonas genovensis]|uniref:glycosyltransferase n=1 Tax=Alteromonas genovensis TaxID=471225 RepID=UPI002FE359F3
MVFKKLNNGFRKVFSKTASNTSEVELSTKIIQQSGKFDSDWYLKSNPDIAAHKYWSKNLIQHYFMHGANEGRNPASWFDSAWYLEEYDDVHEVGMNPFLHYILHGESEGRFTKPKHFAERANADSLSGRQQKASKVLNSKPTNSPMPGLKSAAKSIDLVRRQILNNGFENKGLEELKATFKKSNKLKKLIAAQELALFSLNLGTEKGAMDSLKYLDYCEKHDHYGLKTHDEYTIMRVEARLARGHRNSAKQIIEAETKRGKATPDKNLARANTNLTLERKLIYINRIYRDAELAQIGIKSHPDTEPYVGLYTETTSKTNIPFNKQPLITVIVPAYNAETTIGVALQSLCDQTWENIEVLVADDCSTDKTREVVQNFSDKDSRIKLVKVPQNGGPYVARNYALLEAKGDFVTCNDADDWSHAQKLELQAKHLIENPTSMGNTSKQARSNPDMTFYRRGNFGHYIFTNMSSFMFRRVPVLDKLGFWDSVRFGADSEFIRRLKRCFGAESVVDLVTAPLSFQRQSSDSLTGSSAFGYHGFFMGARKDYFETYLEYHKKEDAITKYSFPLQQRPFDIPEPMRPARAAKESDGTRRFDVIIASDFRLDGGSTLSSIEEIKANKRAGLRTGLVQMYRYDYNPRKRVNAKIRELLDGSSVEMIVYGEKVSCEHLVLRYPPVLQHDQKYVPKIKAKRVSIIVNQPPMSDYGESAVLRYELEDANALAEKLFVTKPVWYPIGPAVRDALVNHHADSIHHISLSSDDWPNVIDVDEWQRSDYKPNTTLPIIGRHSRDSLHKWPGDKSTLLQIYPNAEDIKVSILGGVNSAQSVIGKIPSNWETFEFGELHPAEFLSKLDVFVYFTHSDWVESFGRVVLEAMAVGVPVILPHIYKPLFGDAAIYVKESEVVDMVKNIVADQALYDEYVRRGLELVRNKFSYKAHIDRL